MGGYLGYQSEVGLNDELRREVVTAKTCLAEQPNITTVNQQMLDCFRFGAPDGAPMVPTSTIRLLQDFSEARVPYVGFSTRTPTSRVLKFIAFGNKEAASVEPDRMAEWILLGALFPFYLDMRVRADNA